jgi:hypothetical protein
MNYSQLVTEVNSYLEYTFPTNDINTFIQQAEQRVFNTIQFPSLRKNVTGVLTAGNSYLSAPNDFLAPYSLAVFSSVTTTATGTVSTNTITVASNANIFIGQNVSGSGIGNQCKVIGISGLTITLSQNNINNVSGNILFQTDYLYLLNKDVNFIRECYPTSSYQNQPRHYALFGPQSTAPLYLSFMVGPTPDQSYSVELHYFYYPDSIVQAPITAFGNITSGGSGYVSGTYYNVPLSGGTGTFGYANVVVTAGVVTSATLNSGGTGYVVGDSLTVNNSYLGGAGLGFAIPVLTVANPLGQSWLGNNFDSVLLYGTLIEAYTYQKGDDKLIAFYENKYKEALAIAKRLGDGLERQDAYRSGQFRINPVP